MAGLQTSVGLISGIDIQGVVDQLMAIESVTKENLVDRTDRLKKQQAALVQLTNLFDTTTYMMKNLAKAEIFTRRDPKSSNEQALKVSRSGNPSPGNYTFTPLKMASSQTTMTQGVAADDEALGQEGEVKIKFGRDLNTNYDLQDINGGSGFQRGYVRITDASGARANVDLRTAQTMQDILDTINNCMDVDVFASLEGDQIVLSDYSGGTGQLRVQDVNNGTTAHSLGLTDATVREDGSLIGKKLLRLGADTSLSLLNDGNGLTFDNLLADLKVTLSDGTVINVDFNEYFSPTAEEMEAGAKSGPKYMKTVGDLLDVFNAAGKVTKNGEEKQMLLVGISEDGKRLVMKDLSEGSGTMKVEQTATNPASIKPIMYQLGLAGYGQESVEADSTGTIAGRAILGDMDSVLLSSLNGGRGYSEEDIFEGNDLAYLAVEDRAGNFSVLTVSRDEYRQCETLQDMVRLINGKMADAFAYDENQEPVLKTDADGNPIYRFFDDEQQFLRYITDQNGTIPFETEKGLQTSSEVPTANYEWIKDSNDQVVGYRVFSDPTTVDLSSYLALTGGEYPQLNEKGELDTFSIIATTDFALEDYELTYSGDETTMSLIDPEASFGTHTDGEKITKLHYDDSDGRKEFLGYYYVSEEDDGSGNTVEVERYHAFTDVYKKALRQDFAEGEAPNIVGGKLERAEPEAYGIITTSLQDGAPAYTFEDDGFEIEWTYDESTGEVIGYKRTTFSDHTFTAEEQAAFDEVWNQIKATEEDPTSVDVLIYPLFTEDGKLNFTERPKTTATDPKESSDPDLQAKYADITWEFAEGKGPEEGGFPIGYFLHKDSDYEQHVRFDSAMEGYPELKMEKLPEYQKTEIGLKLQLGSNGQGLDLVDTTGEYQNGITFANFAQGYGKLATMLGFGAVNRASNAVKGADLNLQTVSANTKISDLNGGAGVNTEKAVLTIRDTKGATTTIDFDQDKPETLGDIIDMINQRSASVLARINNTGDGILLQEMYSETSAGVGNTHDFTVSMIGGNDNIAKQLGIQTGTVKREDRTITTDPDTGARTSSDILSLNGSTTHTIQVEATDTLDDIRTKLNDLDAGFKVTTVNDGTAKPYRLSIASTTTGSRGQMNVDFSGIGLGTTTMSKAQDAVMLYGDPDNPDALILNSSTNSFNNVVPGINLTINSITKEPINVWTENSSVEIKTSLKAFVENYNKYRQFYNEATLVDIDAGTKGLLAMDPTLQQMDREMTELILKQFYDLGDVRGLAALGITLDPTSSDEEGNPIAKSAGYITFDESVFDELFASNPEAIAEFFTKTHEIINDKGELDKEQIGFASFFVKLGAYYSDNGTDSVLVSKYDSLETQIWKNEDRIDFMEERLEAKRQMYLKQFYNMEAAMAKMQADMEYVNKIGSSSGSSGTTTS